MSLHPITKSRHSRKTRGAYRSFRSREQWKPWTGWNYHVSKNPLDWFGSKRFVLGIVSLTIILGGMVLAQGPLFHSFESSPPACHIFPSWSSSGCRDPIQTIWNSTSSNDFNLYAGNKTINTVAACFDFLPASASCLNLQASHSN